MATTLYTLDRLNSYSPGTRISLRSPNYAPLLPLGPARQLDSNFLAGQFPDGLSNHGQRYLINWSVAPGLVDTNMGESLTYSASTIELVFELVRRLEFPDSFSRFASFFGCRDEAELRTFAAKKNSTGTIYEVEVGEFQVRDMSLLDLGDTNSHAWLNARKYWSEADSGDPIWECLIKLPVTIGKQVGKI